MKLKIFLILFFITIFCFSQNEKQQRIDQIRNQLTALSVDNNGLTENVKTDITVNDMTLSKFLLGISEIHELNINVNPQLDQIKIANNFKNVPVADVLVWLCKEYDLTIDFTGNILSIRKYSPPIVESIKKEPSIVYNSDSDLISIDIKDDRLYEVFKLIMDQTGKNLAFTPGLENKLLTAYILQTPFDIAMDKLGYTNNLYTEKTKDNFYLFENSFNSDISATESSNNQQTTIRPLRRRNSNIYFKILDIENKLIEVDFQNAPISDIINDIGNALDINIFTATPLDEAGTATFKAKSINFDDLLVKIFEIQPLTNSQPAGQQPSRSGAQQSQVSSDKFTFKKENNIYYFGTEQQLSVRKVEIIYLKHRSVSLLNDPQNTLGNNNNNNNGLNSYNMNSNTSFNQFDNIGSRNQPPTSQNQRNNGSFISDSGEKTLIDIIPSEITDKLDIQTDFELNCFYVNGSSTDIERLKTFLTKIDKPVPVVLIEVMFIEVNNNTNLEAGVSWGIGETPTTTQGNIFPTTDVNLGAEAVNSILSNFNSFAGFNLGKVTSNFFASIKLNETNGNLKVRSTPKLATLNGHRATFSNGQTSYYAVTQRNIYGTDNPQTSEITNYYPIEAQLGLIIKPSVSGDGQVLLDINVIQSAFGSRIAEEAPPNINSRTFSSIIRMEDQDVAILGGLEENSQNNTSTGVPLLARIPIIKWLFSKQVRNGSKSKLTVLIKPTVYY